MVGTNPTIRPSAWACATADRTSSTDSTSSITPLPPVLRPATMRAIGIVQAIVGDEEVVEDLAAEDRPRHDPGHVLDRDPAVPDPLRVDHHRRPVLALL